MKIIYTFIILVACAMGAVAQKNVLVIAVDDLKPLLSPYGHTIIHSPNIDRLAAMGMTFLNTSCQQAVCAPSRASLLTGLYPDATGVWDLNTQIRDKRPDVTTLPQHFRNQGYFTTGAGKLFDPRSVDDDYDELSWSEEYFHSVDDEYYDPTLGKGYSGYQNPQVPIDDKKYEQYLQDNNIGNSGDMNDAVKRFPFAKPTTEGMDVPDDAYKDGATTNYILEKLTKLSVGSDPFFLVVGYSKPHLPFVAPSKYWDLYERGAIDIHPSQLQPADVVSLAWRNNGELTNSYSDVPRFNDRNLSVEEQKLLIYGYMACVSYIDAQLGKVLDKLDELNLTGNTTIVLWGDHGWHLGDHNLWAKHSNFEQAVMSPLIIYDPQSGKGGEISSSPVELVDIFPTLCELTGIDKPAGLQGKSLVEILKDPLHKVREAALSQYPRRSGGENHMGYTLRDTTYRFTKWIKMDYENGERYGEAVGFQLYDLIADPYETTNLIGNSDYDDVVDYFEALLKKRNIAQSTPSSYLQVITCENSYIAPNGSVYSESGTYTNTLTAKNGMDSLITIDLTFKPAVDVDLMFTEGQLITPIEGYSYQWKDCQNQENIPGETAQSFTPTMEGDYAVEISDNFCSFISECVYIEPESPVLGMKDLKDIRLYPVPLVGEKLNIDLCGRYSKVGVRITNLSGQLVFSSTYLELGTVNFHFSQPPGMYIVHLQMDREETEIKFLVD